MAVNRELDAFLHVHPSDFAPADRAGTTGVHVVAPNFTVAGEYALVVELSVNPAVIDVCVASPHPEHTHAHAHHHEVEFDPYTDPLGVDDDQSATDGHDVAPSLPLVSVQAVVWVTVEDPSGAGNTRDASTQRDSRGWCVVEGKPGGDDSRYTSTFDLRAQEERCCAGSVAGAEAAAPCYVGEARATLVQETDAPSRVHTERLGTPRGRLRVPAPTCLMLSVGLVTRDATTAVALTSLLGAPGHVLLVKNVRALCVYVAVCVCGCV